MKGITRTLRRSLLLGAGSLALLIAGCSSMPSWMGGGQAVHVDLGGGQEVPPVVVDGTGTGTIKVASNGSVSGSVTTHDVAGIAAHIHQGAIGQNGPVIIPLMKTGPDTWSVPKGAKLNDAQMAAFKRGDLYVNVHTARHRGGEVRGQIVP